MCTKPWSEWSEIPNWAELTACWSARAEQELDDQSSYKMQEYQNYDHYKGKKIITKLITTRWCSQSWPHKAKPLPELRLDLTWRIILLIITEFMNGCYQMSMIFTVWWLLCSPWSKLAWHPKRLNVLYIRTHCYIILRALDIFNLEDTAFTRLFVFGPYFNFNASRRRKKTWDCTWESTA